MRFANSIKHLRAVADLRDAAGERLDVGQPHRLDRVDHQHVGDAALERVEDRAQVRFRKDEQRLRRADALRAQLRLRRRLFTAYVNRARVARREAGRELQQKRRLPCAGRAAQQHQAARDDPAAEQRVELRHPGPAPRDPRLIDRGERDRRVLPQRGDGSGLRRLHRFDDRRVLEGVPGVARRAAAEPARRLEPAPRAEVDRLGLRHGAIVARRCARCLAVRSPPGQHLSSTANRLADPRRRRCRARRMRRRNATLSVPNVSWPTRAGRSCA